MTREQLQAYAEQVVGPNPRPFTAEQQHVLVAAFGPVMQAKAGTSARKTRARKTGTAAA